MASGDVGEPFEAHVAVDMAHAPEDHLAGPESWPKASSTSVSRAASRSV